MVKTLNPTIIVEELAVVRRLAVVPDTEKNGLGWIDPGKLKRTVGFVNANIDVAGRPRRFGIASSVLRRSMRVDEIGDIDRQTNQPRRAVQLSVLGRETRFPFVINLPQQDMEPVLVEPVRGQLRLSHRLTRFEQKADRVVLHFNTPEGEKSAEAKYLLGCDGGRSTVREQLGIPVEGKSLSSTRWSISRSISISQIPATTLTSRTFPTRGSG